MKVKNADVDWSAELLGEKYTRGADVSVLRLSSSPSGMTHRMLVLTPTDNGGVMNVSFHVSALTGLGYDQKLGAVVMKGAGMDMGAAVVMKLATALHGDAYALHHRHV